MDQILGEIGKALAGFFSSPVVQFVIYSIAVYLVVLWLASAYWVFRDMQQRTENAILPYLAASLVIVFLPVFPLAVFVYKIIRPHEKIGEVYERNLAEEALLAEVEVDQELSDMRPAGERRMDHLPDLPDPPEPGLPELQPARRPRLVAVRVVRQGLRTTRGGDRIVGRPPGTDLAASGRRRHGADRADGPDRDRLGPDRHVDDVAAAPLVPAVVGAAHRARRPPGELTRA